MRQSITRRFISLAYERIGILLLWGLLRSLPWLPPLLLLSYLPAEALLPERYLLLGLGSGLISLLTIPLLTGGIHQLCSRLARGEDPDSSELLAGCGRRYGSLLVLAAFQLLVAVTLLRSIQLVFLSDSFEPGFRDYLGLGSCVWLLLLLRIWNFYFLPLYLGGDRNFRNTARLTLYLLLGRPVLVLRHLAQRQLIGGLLGISGLGLFLGQGSFVALHAALCARAALREAGLAGDEQPGDDEENDSSAEGFNLRRWLRPWE